MDDAVRARERLNTLMGKALEEGFSEGLRADIDSAKRELDSAVYGAYLTDDDFG